MTIAATVRRLLRRFRSETRAASAVEFALIAYPFLFLIMCILQMGIYYMAQASLDSGVIQTADAIRASFATASPTFPSASTLKSQIATGSGGMVSNNGDLAVELRQLTSLSGSSVAVTDGTADYGSATSVLVLRAQAVAPTFAPGFSVLTKVSSTALIRRQGR